MPSAERELLLPLWEPAATDDNEEKGEEPTSTMILVSVPAALESVLRAVVRDVDSVDAELREKISDHLPSLEDREKAAADASSAAGSESRADGDKKSQAAAVALPPATLAKAIPHIRRLMPHVGAEDDGNLAGVWGLLRGGGLVFPDTPGVGLLAKQGEEKRNYEERRKRLLLLREQKEYARMTSNIQRAPRETVRDIQASFKFQAGMGANMVIAVVTAFIISYWASKFVVDNNTTHRLVIGLVGAVFMLLVELLVFVTRSLKADEVLEAARQAAEESHTAVGVHKLAQRVEPRGGRGVLEETKRQDRGEYELVGSGIGESAEELPQRRGLARKDPDDAGAGIARISKG